MARDPDKAAAGGFADRPTVDGYAPDECISALIKSTRRGREEDALYWCSQLDRSGLGPWAFARIKTLATEDVGLAAPLGLIADVRALYENFVEARRAKNGSDRLYLVHALLLVVRAKKSRLIDSAGIVFWEGREPTRQVDEASVDRHTRRGRRLGRGWTHWWAEGTRLENAAPLDDPYRERAQQVRSDTKPLAQGQTSLLDES